MKVRKNRGITIISLAITIIVLLILSGVTISTLTSENGIISRANVSKIATELARYNEEAEQWKLAREMDEDEDFQEDTLSAGKSNLSYNGEKKDGNIKTIIPDMLDEYLDEIEIIKGKLTINTTSNLKTQAAKIASLPSNPYEIKDGVLQSTGSNLDLVASDGTLTIPENVTRIASGAFSGVEGLKTVIIPGSCETVGRDVFSYNKTLEKVVMQEGVKYIDPNAFYECTHLKEVVFPNSVIAIGGFAFSRCYALRKIELPDNITELEQETFSGCSRLTSIKLPLNLKEIKYTSLGECYALDNIYIPASVTNIDPAAFRNDTSMTNITIDKNNQNYTFDNNMILKKDKTQIIFLTNANSELTTIKIPDEVEKIQGTALFSVCRKAKEVYLPKNLIKFSGNVFEGLSNIEKITIDNTCENFKVVDNMLLSKDGTELIYTTPKRDRLTIPSTVKTISGMCIAGGWISELNIPDNVETIKGQFAKNGGSIKNVSIGKGVKSLNSSFKDYTGLNNIKLTISSENPYYKVVGNFITDKSGKNAITFINTQANMVIPEGIESIGYFARAGIKTIELPSTLKKIDNLTENDIVSIDIPASVENIEVWTFQSCSKLEKIVVHKKKGSIPNAPWGATKGMKVIEWKEE